MSINNSILSSEIENYNFENETSIEQSINDDDNDNKLNSNPIAIVAISAFETWGYGFLFVTIINMSSVMGILFFPLMKTSLYTVVMRAMIGLAIGTLSGSALFHLIPKAFGLEDGKQGDYLNVAACVWLAIWIAMVLECVIKIGVKTRAQTKLKKKKMMLMNGNVIKENNNPLQKSVIPDESDAPNGNGNYTLGLDAPRIDGEDDLDGLPDKNSLTLPVYHSTFSLNRTVLSAMNIREHDIQEDAKEIKTVAWIIIIGDSLHNFIDGVSIGAGFAQSFQTGFILSLAVIFEEFPHELGDFAILINSGLSVKKALLFNFLSALTCYLGLFLGIMLGKIDWENYIFAFAAGIFIYVSIGDMIPEVTSLIDEVSEISPKKAWNVLLVHNIGILSGVIILFVLANVQP